MHVLEAAFIANWASKSHREATARRKELVPYEPVSRRSIFVAAIGVVAPGASLTELAAGAIATRPAAMADPANDSN